MAMLDIRHILRIKVLEDSAECGVFVVNVCCGEPLLLQFWCRKPPFRNGQVEQTDVRSQAAAEVDFVLRVLHRAPNLPNGHYWGPFVLSLCLDALPFRFCLPAQAHSSSRIQDIMEEGGELRLLRALTVAPVIHFLALNGCIRSASSALISLAPAVVSLPPSHPDLLCTSAQKTNHRNIAGLTARTIVGRALGALRWAKHTITQCGGEDERTAAEAGELEEHSERKQGPRERKEDKDEQRKLFI